MAGQESLGRAILYLSVDDTALRDGVRRARQFVDRELGRRTGQGGRAGANADRAADRRASTMVITRNLGERLNRLEERGVNVAKIRSALDRAALATDQGRLETARSLNKLAREFIISNERGLRGTSRIGRQLADPIDALFQAQKRRYSLDQQIRSLEASGLSTDRFRARLGEITTAQAQRRFGLAKQLSDQLDFDLRKERDKLSFQQKQNALADKAARAGGPTSPIRGNKNLVGSPAYFEEIQRQVQRQSQGRQGRLSSALIGGAFPLLFGQGPGAALGGAIGGFAGGGPLGFGLSLVGTTLGQAFDVAIQKSTQLATALSNPAKNIAALTEASLISSRALEKYTASLIDNGREVQASALLQLDAIQRFGDISGLQALEKEQDKFNRNIALLQVQLGNFVAGPLTAFLQLINKTLNRPGGASADGLPNIPTPQEIQNQQDRSSRLIAAGLAAAAPATVLPPPVGIPLALGGLALSSLGAAMAPEDQSKNLEEFLKLISEIRTEKKLIADINKLDIDATGQLTASEKFSLSISQIKLNLELAILKAKGDQAKIDAAKQAAALATAAAEAEERAHRKQELDSQARAEEQIYKARLRVQLATARLQSVPTLDATQSAEKYLQVQYSIRQAQGEIAAAQIEYNAALKTLKTAQLYGSPMDIFEATAAVEVAALKVQEAGINFNTSLREGALNLAKNVIESAKQFRDSIRAYRDLQQANLRFLPVAQRRQVIEEAKSQGLAEAQRRGVALRNVEDLFNFNKFIEQDAALRQNMLDAQRNVADANATLNSSIVTQTNITEQLTGVMERLVDKSWSVYVQVPGQNGVAGLNLQTQLS